MVASIYGQQPASVNFFNQAPETAVDLNQLQRQRAMAEMLSRQSTTPLEGQMVGGHFVAPTKAAYLAQLASALTGGYANRQADEKERNYAENISRQRAADAQAFMQAANGVPASTREVAGPAAEGQAPPTQTTAAVPGDMNKALAIALQSQNPMLQGMAPKILERNMSDASFNQALQGAGLAPAASGGGPGGGVTTGGPGAMTTGGASNPAGAATGGPAQNTLGIAPAALALSQSSDPRAQALAKMIQEASGPIALGEGGTLIPKTGGAPLYVAPKTVPGVNVTPIAGQPGQYQAIPVQGFGKAQAEISGQVAGAEAAARDPYAGLVKVDTPNGPRMMTPAQARAAAGQGVPTPGMQGPAGPTNAAERGMAADVAQVPFDPAREAAQVREMLATPGAIKDPGDRAQATQFLAKLEGMAGGQGAPAAPPSAPASAGAGGGVGIPLQSEQSQAYATARAKSYAEMAPKLQQGGQDASATLRNLSTLETLYKDPNVAKGALAENISGLKNIGASFGIDMKGLSSEQAAEAITNKMALASRSTAEGGGMPGAMSDADRKFLANMQPGLTKTPEGRAQIIDASKKVAQRQIDVANMARQYEMQNGQLDLGFDKALADYAAQNQLFTQATKGGGSKTNLNDLLKKYR